MYVRSFPPRRPFLPRGNGDRRPPRPGRLRSNLVYYRPIIRAPFTPDRTFRRTRTRFKLTVLRPCPEIVVAGSMQYLDTTHLGLYEGSLGRGTRSGALGGRS